jgi:hypothetical protein
MIEYKIYKSPLKAIKLILLSSLFVFAGIFMLHQTDAPKFIAWLCILFFGLGYPLGLFQLLDRRPQIIINELGIFDRTIHKDFINWDIIQDAYIADIHGQKFICLVVDKKFESSKSKGKFYNNMKAFSKALGFQELNINLSQVKVNAERLTEFILAMRLAEKPKRETIIREALPNMRRNTENH